MQMGKTGWPCWVIAFVAGWFPFIVEQILLSGSFSYFLVPQRQKSRIVKSVKYLQELNIVSKGRTLWLFFSCLYFFLDKKVPKSQDCWIAARCIYSSVEHVARSAIEDRPKGQVSIFCLRIYVNKVLIVSKLQHKHVKEPKISSN